MTLFRRLALASTIATLVLVSIGGLVRATKSGLGCGTNWPHCPGAVNRALIIEASHRAAAGIVILLIASLVVVAYRNRGSLPGMLGLSTAAFFLVMSQAILGAIVVWLELEAESVVLHLATAMALVALLIHITTAALRLERGSIAEPDPGLVRMSTFTAITTLTILLVGSYVTGKGAGLVFPDWPLMDGKVIPDLGIESQAVHFLHRALAGFGLVAVIALAWNARSRDGVAARFTYAAAGLYVVQVLVGALNVWTDLSSAVVAIHLALGSLIWASLVTVAVLSRPARTVLDVERPRTREPVGVGS